MAQSLMRISSAVALAMMLLCFVGSAPLTAGSRAAAAPADDKELAEKGKALYDNKYKCSDCHGMNGEGTPDAPDLIGTRLDADGISAFLQHPSADATNKGMPSFAKDSPDLTPLVAYVLSIKKPQ